MNGAALHLTISTPDRILAQWDDVHSLRAEDASGGFGILPGHADFLTVLGPSVLHWRDGAGATHYCAIRAGVLTVREGARIDVACRQGRLGDDLGRLEQEVRAMRAEEIDAARRAHVEETRLHARAIREIMRHLQPQRNAPLSDLTPGEGGMS